MSGNKTGGLKARETNLARYGLSYYSNIGRIGGKVGRTGGYHVNRDLARESGRKGGKKSRRVYTPAQREAARVRMIEWHQSKKLSDFPLNYEMLNDDNTPLFEQSSTLLEKYKIWLRRNG